MTTPIPLVASVQPTSMQVSSPNEYQVADLTLTVTNVSSAPYDLSNGLKIAIPVDPGGSGSQAALVLSSASSGAGGPGQPTPTVTIGANPVAGTDWGIEPITTGPCDYQALPNGSGLLGAGDSVQFEFTSVVADYVPGNANITATVPPATTTGAALTLTAPITKLPAPLSATLGADPPLLIMPSNTTNLSWQVLGADSCELTWAPTTTVVTYNNEQYYGAWSNPPFQFNPGAPLPVATLYEATTFTLTANGEGKVGTAAQGVTLATPRFTALTIPPVVNGTAPAGGGTAGTPMVTGVEHTGPGDPDGGQVVVITGTGFTGVTSVAFGSASTAEFTPPDTTGSTITATAPPVAVSDVNNSTPGTVVDITVTVGGGTSPATSPVNPADKYTYSNLASSVPVAPYQQFWLVWSCFDGTEPTLSWAPTAQPPESFPNNVTVTGISSGPIQNGGPVAVSDTAFVTISVPTTFTLAIAPQGTPAPVPASVPVGIAPVALSAFSASSPLVNPTTGAQSVTLTWTAQNATSFDLAGGGLLLALPYDQTSYSTNLPLNEPTTYEVLAIGFDDEGNATSKSLTVTVTPVAVHLTSFTAYPMTIDQEGSATLRWDATAATGYTLSPGTLRAHHHSPDRCASG